MAWSSRCSSPTSRSRCTLCSNSGCRGEVADLGEPAGVLELGVGDAPRIPQLAVERDCLFGSAPGADDLRDPRELEPEDVADGDQGQDDPGKDQPEARLAD